MASSHSPYSYPTTSAAVAGGAVAIPGTISGHRGAATAARSRNARLVTQAVTSRQVLQSLIVPVVLLLCRAAPAPLNAVSYPLLAVYAMFGRRQAVVALFMLYIFNCWTHAFGGPPRLASYFRHIDVFAAALSVFVLHLTRPPRSSIPGFLWCTFGLGVLIVGHGVLFSQIRDLSVLKAISFDVTLLTLLAGWSSLDDRNRDLAEKQVLYLLGGLAVASLPLIATPAGYMTINARLFRGLLNHAQMFGPAMGYLATWVAALWLTNHRHALVSLAILGIALTELWLTKSRIGAVIFLVGLLTAITAGPVGRALASPRSGGRIRRTRLAVALLGGLVATAALGPRIATRVDDFLRKGSQQENVTEALASSRLFAIERMTHNIRQRPLTGIGFGVPSDLDAETDWGFARDPIFGLPVMAAIEKGVLPVMVVEELGYPLAVVMAFWFAALFWLAMRGGVVSAGLCAAALIGNIAEASFLSPGGAGLASLTLATMSATAFSRRRPPQG